MQRVNKIISKSRLEGKSGEVRVFCMRIGGGGGEGGSRYIAIDVLESPISTEREGGGGGKGGKAVGKIEIDLLPSSLSA